MCGRFLTPEQAALERHFGLAAPAGYRRSFNVAPGQSATVIHVDPAGAHRAEFQSWGFLPVWASRGWINARSETVFDSKAFGAAARHRRCLVPAAGWYEWQGGSTPKQPYVFHRQFEPLAFAGIWTARETEDGREHSFAILTRPAPASLVRYHDRMPVIIEPPDYAAWLDDDTDRSVLQQVIGGTAEEISVRAVSRFVNKPSNNDERCIEAA